VNLWTRVAVPVGGRPARGGRASIRNATTDSEGRFLLDQLEAGSYAITINVSGYANKSLESIGAGTSDLRVVLEKGLSISGRVLLPDGSPAANRWITARSEKDDTHSDRTGEDGTFEIENLPEGVYDVWANTGGAFRFMEGVEDDGPSLMPTQQAGVPAGTKNLEIRLRQGAVVGGRVTDENGSPIRGASLWVRSLGEGENASGWSQTDENGEFRVTGLAPGRRVSINVSHGDYGPLATQEVDSDSTGLSFVLPPKPTRPDPKEQPTEPR
jgi:hypothetical protein